MISFVKIPIYFRTNLGVESGMNRIGREEDDTGSKRLDHRIPSTARRQEDENPRRDFLEKFEQAIRSLECQRIDAFDDENILSIIRPYRCLLYDFTGLVNLDRTGLIFEEKYSWTVIFPKFRNIGKVCSFDEIHRLYHLIVLEYERWERIARLELFEESEKIGICHLQNGALWIICSRFEYIQFFLFVNFHLMSNRLLSIIILVIFFGGISGVFYYFFVANTATVSFTVNGSGPATLELTSEFKNSYKKTCEKVCTFEKIPPVGYVLSAKRDGYVPLLQNIGIERGVSTIALKMEKEITLDTYKKKKEEIINTLRLKKAV